MKEIPWLDKIVKYQIKSGPYTGYTIEEAKAPWDLFIEGKLCNTNLGEESHVLYVEGKNERIFSIRNQHREPEVSIVCIPPESPLMKQDWTRERPLKTSSIMTIDGQPLRIISILTRRSGKNVPRDMLKVIEAFFIEYGGTLDNEWPNGMVVSQKNNSNNNDKGYNLCIASKTRLSKECSKQAFGPESAIGMLRSGVYDDIYLYANDPWMSQVLEFIKKNPLLAPKRNLFVFGEKEKRKVLLGQYEE